MKKLFTLLITLMLAFTCLMSGCGDDAEESAGPQFTPVQFGVFGYNGNYLTSYAAKEISAEEAKGITNRSASQIVLSSLVNPSTFSIPSTPKTNIDSVLMEYSNLYIYTKYYENGKEEMQVKRDSLSGTDFKAVLEANSLAPFSQLVAKGVLIYSDLIDYMEEQNRIFRLSDESKIAPFKNVFSYHTDTKGNLVIQTKDFAEIPSSVGGGIGCNFLQYTEIVYDAENKVSHWQTSLGLQSSTPNGTIGQGYILEMDFDWIKKV